MSKSSRILITISALTLTIGMVSSAQSIKSSAQINPTLSGQTTRKVSETDKTLTSSLEQSYKLKSQGRIEYDNDGDGVPEVVFDAEDFITLLRICE